MGKLIIRKQCGFTVVELMVVLALLGIVLALGYMFFGFGISTFARGERQTIAQQEIRRGAEFITSELRFANKITIEPADLTEGGYYYIYQEGDSVVYKDKSGQERVVLDSSADGITYLISFNEESVQESRDYGLIIKFVLEAEDNLYVLDTNVYIMNLRNKNNYQDLSTQNGSASAIKFSKPLF